VALSLCRTRCTSVDNVSLLKNIQQDDNPEKAEANNFLSIILHLNSSMQQINRNKPSLFHYPTNYCHQLLIMQSINFYQRYSNVRHKSSDESAIWKMSYSTASVTFFSLHSPLGFDECNYPCLQNAYISKKGNVCFLLGNSPGSEFCMPTFQNTLFIFTGR